MKDECELCGRTEDEAEELKEHQGFTKCHRCVREYESGAVKTVTSDDDDRTVEKDKEDFDESMDWKKHALA